MPFIRRTMVWWPQCAGALVIFQRSRPRAHDCAVEICVPGSGDPTPARTKMLDDVLRVM